MRMSVLMRTGTLETLSAAYQRVHGERVSRSMVSQYFKELGYKFKKARKVLTSPDPRVPDKAQTHQEILSRLGQREKFFSIDKFGPCAVKRRGGVALLPVDEIRTIPQRQRSKGSRICTAALELSTNQVTHFYSKRKNTAEMIKMLGLGQGAQRLLEALRRPMSGRELARDLKITKQRVHQLVVKLHGMGHVRLATRRGFCTSSHSADPNRSGKG
jgi:hypothetical protein